MKMKAWVMAAAAAAMWPAGSRAATVTLDWIAVTSNADGSPFASPASPTPGELSGYRVFYRTTPLAAMTTAQAMTDGSVTRLDVGNVVTRPLDLLDGTSYYFRLTARDVSNNQSGWSVENDGFTVLEASTFTAVPATPDTVGASPLSHTQIQFGWRDTSGGETGFRIERSSPDNGSYTLLSSPPAGAGAGAARTYLDGSLTPQTTYYYRVRANGTSADSPFVEVFTVTPPAPTAPPTQPSNLRVTSVTGSQINLAWNDLSLNETGFELRWSLNGTSGWVVVPLGVGVAAYPHGSLTAGTSYYYQVRAVNGVGPLPPFGPTIPVLGRTTGGAGPAGFTPPPGLRQAYAYPNPARGVDPVIRAMMGGVDFVEVTIFDQSGAVVHGGRTTTQVSVNGEPAFEYRWTGDKSPGVYYAVIHGRKGDETVRARAKFAVVR